MTDKELKEAIFEFLVKSQHLPFEEQPTSITIEEEFEHEGVARVKQCLGELVQEGRIQSGELYGRTAATDNDKPQAGRVIHELKALSSDADVSEYFNLPAGTIKAGEAVKQCERQQPNVQVRANANRTGLEFGQKVAAVIIPPKTTR